MRVLSSADLFDTGHSLTDVRPGSMFSPGSLEVAPSQPAVGLMRVRLRGELDRLTVARSARVLRNAVDAIASEAARTPEPSGPVERGRVVCDLDGLAFMAVCGVRMLLDTAEYADGLGVDFVVLASRRPVRQVLDLAGPINGVSEEPPRHMPREHRARGAATGRAS